MAMRIVEGEHPFLAKSGVAWKLIVQKREVGDYRWFLVLAGSYGPSTQYRITPVPPTLNEALAYIRENDVQPQRLEVNLEDFGA